MQVTSTSLELVCILFKMIFVQNDFYSKTGSYLNEKRDADYTAFTNLHYPCCPM